MKETEGNLPAFPCPSPIHGEPATGLTKREYFAAMAMQGILANSAIPNDKILQHMNIEQQSVKMADALIEQLNK